MVRRIIIESLHQEFLKRLPKRLLPVMNEMAFILQPHPFPVDFPSLMNSGDFYFLSLFPSPLMFDIKAVHFHKENRLVHGLPFGILDASKRCFRIVSWLITDSREAFLTYGPLFDRKGLEWPIRWPLPPSTG
jgi:hypothetical protein